MSAPAAPRGRLRPNLHSIPAGQDFLDVLADAVLGGRLDLGLDLDDPAALARLTVYLPTRRAARAFAAVLLRASGRKALILPRLVPLGDPGEAELHELMDAPPAEAAEVDGPLPIRPLARQMLLARQIQRVSLVRDRALAEAGSEGGSLAASTLGSAFALAGDLAAILDAMQAEDVGFERLKALEAARFDEFWQLTARFLAIIGETWPAILAERGEVDPITWRNRLLDAQSARLASSADHDPVIVAGSTGSMPATARLIGVVARMRRGAVVLPDLDIEGDEAGWTALAEEAASRPDRAASHPQAQLARLLAGITAARSDVRQLLQGEAGAPRMLRRSLALEALRPASGADAWRDIEARLPAARIGEALHDVTVIEAPDERLESLTLALAIREALDGDAGSIALVTPDRGLAERVALELGRWNIAVDDSAGQPLGRTSAGHVFALLLAVVQSGGSSQTLLELIHHPRIRLGFAPDDFARARSAFEIGALRGARPFQGVDGLAAAIEAMPARIDDWRAPGPRRRLRPQEVDAARTLAQRLGEALRLLLHSAEGAEIVDLASCLHCLRDAIATLTAGPGGEAAAFGREDGEALRLLLDDLCAACAGSAGSVDDLARICRVAMAERVVRVRGLAHPRVVLLGLLEARLMRADLMILGGLNEGVWPPRSATDPFLNRAMRAELGLSSPERRIGQSAHDFVEAFSGARVVLSRAAKTAGVQALPSRFWQRLAAIVPDPVWTAAQERGRRLAAIALEIDRPASVRPWRRPAPRPPAALQPRRLSVTEVETLFRDPYAIHARHVLGLQPLEPMQRPLGAADRGQLLHGVVEAFAKAWPRELPADPLAELVSLGGAVFAPLRHEPDVEGFWWPRFLQLVPAIAQWERNRRGGVAEVGAELRISSELDLRGGGHITLSARADRVERLHDGRLALLDFKSGSVPSPRQVKAGLAPQLFLEAALAGLAPFLPIAEEGAGADSTGRHGAGAPAAASYGPAEVASAAYVALKPDKGGLTVTSVPEDGALAARASEHLAGFLDMIEGFRSGERPFASRFAAQFMRFDGDYDHLARVKEWSAAGHDSDEDAA